MVSSNCLELRELKFKLILTTYAETKYETKTEYKTVTEYKEKEKNEWGQWQ